MSRSGFTIALSEHSKPLETQKKRVERIASSERARRNVCDSYANQITTELLGAREQGFSSLYVDDGRSLGPACTAYTYVHVMD